MLTPETRGIYRDVLGYLRLQDRSGSISGTREEIARAGRCSAVQLQNAVEELKRFKVADVTERDIHRDNSVTKLITITNRRMVKEAQERENANKRQLKRRFNAGSTPVKKPPLQRRDKGRDKSVTRCLSPQTPKSIDSFDRKKPDESQFIQSNPTAASLNKLTMEAGALSRVASEIRSNRHGWAYDNCKVQPDMFPFTTSLIKVLAPFSGRISETAVHTAWQEAVTRTHRAAVDGLVTTNPAGYCVKCFREAIQAEIKNPRQ